MGDSGLPVAGWYPAAHANGEERWWDGTRWFEGDEAATAVIGAATTALPGHAPAARDGAEPVRQPGVIRRRTGAVFAGAALIVGLLFGAASGGIGSLGERDTLKAQVSALAAEVADAESAVDTAEDAVDTAREDLEAAKARATAAEQKLTGANAQVTALEAAAVTAKADLDARVAEIADLKAKIPASTEPVQSTPVQEASAPVNVSYANCTEARNAGAAPVRRGDPGYSSRLDRDGDGIGCE